MDHFSINDLRTEALNAVDEYTASCTVVITSENPNVEHGTGVAVKYGGKDSILTAAHVLDGEPDNDKIRIMGRPDGCLQLLQGKKELADAIAKRTHRPEFSSPTPVHIMCRLRHDRHDITVLVIQDPNEVLPLTIFHDVSGQGPVHVSPGEGLSISGFPGEIARNYERQSTGQRGWAVFPHVTQQAIKDIAAARGVTSDAMDPDVDLITDFDYPEGDCDPRGMSGGGAWTIPKTEKGKMWSASQTQLVGILSGNYRRKLLRFVRIEVALRMLDTVR